MESGLKTEYPLETGVGVATRLEDLPRFRDPDCAALVWNRLAPQGLKDWINGLDPAHLPRWREVVAAEVVSEAVLDACEEAGTPECEERTAPIADIQALSHAFAELMETSFVQLRLDVIKSNACRRFHVDAITARMVCTYRGTGTQFGTSHGGQEPTRIHTVSSQSPIFLRGSLWSETPASNLLHRSPPIEGTGETRLLLVLDPASDSTESDD